MATPYPIADLSRAGAFAIVRRHGDVSRLRTHIRGQDAGAIDLGQRVPTGNAHLAPHWMWMGRGAHVLDVMACVGTIPSGRGSLEVFAVETRPGWFQEVGVPVADDLDADGVCRCGCGYRTKGDSR